MSQRLSRLEECQCKICSSMVFEVLELVIYPPFPPPTVEYPWAWYRNAEGNDEDDDDDEIEEESK
jgi:hypothetical protein